MDTGGEYRWNRYSYSSYVRNSQKLNFVTNTWILVNPLSLKMFKYCCLDKFNIEFNGNFNFYSCFSGNFNSYKPQYFIKFQS